MKMTVIFMKEEVYMYSSLETGGMPHHATHEEEPGSVRKQKEQENMGKSLYCGFQRKKRER